jgi:hypothetical protein
LKEKLSGSYEILNKKNKELNDILKKCEEISEEN